MSWCWLGQKKVPWERKSTGKTKGVSEVSEREEGTKKEMERGKKSSQSQKQGQCFASVLWHQHPTSNSPVAAETPENQSEPVPSRLDHWKFSWWDLLESLNFFCSISPSRRHDPVAIWAHLDPLLKVVRERHPQCSKLHFSATGPQHSFDKREFFFYWSTEPCKYGFKEITWNFFEASHGKGAPDGVGGALERSADQIVAHGRDIPDAQRLFDKLKSLDTSVELVFISERDMESKTEVPAIAAIKGTMRIHQAFWHLVKWNNKREEGVWTAPAKTFKMSLQLMFLFHLTGSQHVERHWIILGDQKRLR